MHPPHLSEIILRGLKVPQQDINRYYELLGQLRTRIHPGGLLVPDPREYFLRCPDGTRIFCQEWVPPKTRAIIMCQHGNNVHGDIFFPLVDALYPAGIAIIAVDNRGHGRSGPFRGHNDAPAQMNAIYYHILKRCAQEFPGVRCFFLGESLGTCIATNFAARYANRCPNLVSIIFMVSPFRLRAEKLVRLILPILTLVVLLFRGILGPHGYIKLPQDYNNPTYLPEFNAYDRFDRMNSRANTSTNLSHLIWLILSFRPRVSKIQLPILILQGTGDKMVDPQGTRKLYVKVRSRKKKLLFYQDANHSLFMDQHSQEIYEHIRSWVESFVESKKA